MRHFQFSLRALLQTTAAVALLFGFGQLSGNAKLGYVRLLFHSSAFLVLLALFFPHAWHFARTTRRSLLGPTPPPDELADAEPIRLDTPPPGEED
jgi:hypothetical protein